MSNLKIEGVHLWWVSMCRDDNGLFIGLSIVKCLQKEAIAKAIEISPLDSIEGVDFMILPSTHEHLIAEGKEVGQFYPPEDCEVIPMHDELQRDIEEFAFETVRASMN